jgi:hypothetical protein
MDMSKIGNYVLEMQEDAVRMSLQQFINRYGFNAAEMWHDVNFGDDRDVEPDYEAMEEGYYG